MSGFGRDNGRWEETKVLRGSRKEFQSSFKDGKSGPGDSRGSAEDQSDLIVLGCHQGRCVCMGTGESQFLSKWSTTPPAPSSCQRGAADHRILACLDQGYITKNLSRNDQSDDHNSWCPTGARRAWQNGDINKSVYTRLIEIGDRLQ